MKVLIRKKFNSFLASALAFSLLWALLPIKSFADGESFELEDLTPIRDAVTATMGDDTIVGAAATLDELRNNGIEALIEKHFNAVTFGNELKPDALFNYSNGTCPGTKEIEFNGETMTVPVMNFSRAEAMLDIIYDWNQANPDKAIKVRGHVLVWHAQTPEWFFHVDYDKNKDYVSKKEMSKRLEWYISEVFNHFTGPDSKYAGMFYGWDVVNEAISDGTNTYRSDNENPNEPLSQDTHGSNSSWWHVYQSNEYIIEAFRYANKYAPSDVDLYYNDYNECVLLKCNGIAQLLEDVKAAEGTRIDGFGMQGHYSSSELMGSLFETCAKRYLSTGVKVMITEWDLKSSNYDPTDEASKVSEYTRQGRMYEDVYKKLVSLKADGYDIAGFTFWGTIDSYSWLQFQNNVGGAADGKTAQCPLLFDGDFKSKPAYWAFVDSSKINDMNNEYKERLKAESAEAEAEELKEAAKENAEETVEAASDESVNETVEGTSDEAIIDTSDDSSDTTGKRTHNSSTVILLIAIFAAILGVFIPYIKKRNMGSEEEKNDAQRAEKTEEK